MMEIDEWKKKNIPKREKPLTNRERYIAKKCMPWRMEKGLPAKAVRRLLKAREKKETSQNFESLFRDMRKGFSSFDEFNEASWNYRSWMKYQGYIYRDYVGAKMAVEGKSEDEIARLLLLEEV